MKTCYLLFILLISSALASKSFAQTHYDNLKEAERQRALTNERNKERDRQNLENNRPVERQNSTTSNSTTSNANAEAKRIAQEKYNEKLLQEQEERRKSQYRTPDQAYADYLAKSKYESEKFVLQTYASELTKVGYEYCEADKITRKYKLDLLWQSSNAAKGQEEFYEVLNCLKRVKENYSTATFEILHSDIRKLLSTGAPIAALDCIELIESRFPDKKEEFIDLETDLVVNYFYSYEYNQDLFRMRDLYFKLEDENPQIYNRFKSKSDDWKGQNTPYQRLASQYDIIINCSTCKYSGAEKRDAKSALKSNKEREEAICKKTNRNYHKVETSKGKISYFNPDKVEITYEEFLTQLLLTKDKDYRIDYEATISLELIQKLAATIKVTPSDFIWKKLRIEPKDKFELLLKMAENNDYQAMRSAYEQEKNERYKDINASYHLKDKWFDYFATRAVQGNVEALNMLYESYNDYHRKQYNNKNTSHPTDFENVFNAFANKATVSQVVDFAEPIAVEYLSVNRLSTDVSNSYITKMQKVCVNAIYKLAQKGNVKSIELTKKWNKIDAEKVAKEEAEKADCTKSIYYSSQKQDGCGTERFSNGDLYQGPFKNGYYNGIGRFEKYKRWVYDGDFVNGKKHGKGTLRYQNGNVYEGDFVKEEQTYGKLTYTDGRVYEGQFLNGLRNGKGNLKYKSGSTYTGDFVNDLSQGKGKFIYASGDVYQGDFVNNDFEGKGTYTYSNGNLYEGDFKKGKFHGKGKLIKKSGYYAIGNFENNNIISLNYFNPSKVEITKEEFDLSK